MRRIVAGVALAIAAAGIAVPAQAQERDCDTHFYRDGASVEAFCYGREGRPYRVIAYCETPLARWTVSGDVGRANRYESRADCHSVLGPVWVDDYRIDWL
jgi:hypothetical protein